MGHDIEDYSEIIMHLFHGLGDVHIGVRGDWFFLEPLFINQEDPN